MAGGGEIRGSGVFYGGLERCCEREDIGKKNLRTIERATQALSHDDAWRALCCPSVTKYPPVCTGGCYVL